MKELLAKYAGAPVAFAAYGASVSDVFNNFFEQWAPTLEGLTLIGGLLAAAATTYYYIRQGRK